MINFQKAFKIGRPLFERVGKQVLRKHRATIFDKGQDSHEKSFESYAPYKPKYRERKKAGKAAPKGRVQKSFSATPDLTLTGDMKKSFSHMKATAHGFEYGIKDPAMAERMEFQSSKKKFGRKRFVSTEADPTTPEAQKLIVEEIRDKIVKNFTNEVRKHGMGVKVYEI